MTTIAKVIPTEYRSDVERAVAISKEEGCRDVYIFGSVAAGHPGPRSDLDIAVRGCPPTRFYRLLGRLLDELGHVVDLIDLDIDTGIGKILEEEGQLIHVG